MSISCMYVDGKCEGDVGVLTLMLKGNPVQVREDHSAFKEIREGLKTGISEDDMLALINKPAEAVKPKATTLQPFTAKSVTVTSDSVYYDGIKVDDAIADTILKMQEQDLPMTGIVNFLERLYTNVSHRVRQELFGWVKRRGIVITENGELVLYKAVCNDYYDKYSRKIKYLPGTSPYQDRDETDPDYHKECSKGLHVGSLEYIRQFGSGDDKIIICIVAPEDVVSVPASDTWGKIRAWKVFVLGDYQGKLEKVAYATPNSIEDLYEENEGDEFDWSDIDDDYEDDDYDDDEDCDCGCNDYDDNDYDDYDDDECTEYDEDYDDEGDYIHHCYRDDKVTNRNNEPEKYGVKPSGQRYYNGRGPDGKFAKKT